MNFASQSINETFQYVLHVEDDSTLFDGTGSQLTFLDITASYVTSATPSDSASYALSASRAEIATSSSYSLSSSWSPGGASVSASYSLSASRSETSNTANTSTSASYALSSSKSETAGTANALSFTPATSSNANTSSWALNSISSSRSETAGTANALSFVPSTSSYATTAGVANSLSFTPATASNANTASWAINAINGGTTLITASSYPITSSWSSNSVSASRSEIAGTANAISFVPSTSSYATVAGTANALSFTPTTASNANTSSWALNSISASRSEIAGTANAISFVPSTSSYSTVAGTANAISFVPATASNAKTSSWALNLAGSVTSASYALSSSRSETAGTANAISFTPSTASNANTASWALNAISSSYSTSASYAPSSPSVSASYAATASALTQTIGDTLISGSLKWLGHSQIYSRDSGIITMADVSGVTFNQLNFGGNTATYPSIATIAGGELVLVKADNSDWTNLTLNTLITKQSISCADSMSCHAITASVGIQSPIFLGTATNVNILTTGSNTAYPVPFVFNSGSGNNVYMDWTASHITFNPSSNTLHVANLDGTASYANTSSWALSIATASHATIADTSSFGGIRAWGHLRVSASAIVAVGSQAIGCLVARSAAGLYGVSFSTAASNTMYDVGITAISGNNPGTTVGFAGSPFSHSTSGFSMSFSIVTTPATRADFTTASFNVIYN